VNLGLYFRSRFFAVVAKSLTRDIKEVKAQVTWQQDTTIEINPLVEVVM